VIKRVEVGLHSRQGQYSSREFGYPRRDYRKFHRETWKYGGNLKDFTDELFYIFWEADVFWAETRGSILWGWIIVS